ncbi:MAG TPA: hypothetical protein VGS57_06550 [Thermoanaerobaculia bacterium]|jgi:exosortase/archaeosortase|nr:hypothetical protein [Thermoanaerobaculia bacterium]
MLPIAEMAATGESGSFLAAIPAILKFGAIGLAFLALLFCYQLLRALIGNSKQPKQVFVLATLFLALSLAFVVVAAFIDTHPVRMAIVLSPARNEELAVLRLGGRTVVLTRGTSEVEVSPNTSLSIDVDPLITRLDRCTLVGGLTLASNGKGQAGVENGI